MLCNSGRHKYFDAYFVGTMKWETAEYRWQWQLFADDVRSQKPMAVKNYSCANDDGCCDVRNMLS
jgi:hypothetical protein